MTTAKAYARTFGEPGAGGAAWESNLAAFEFRRGRIVPYGKFSPGLDLHGLSGPGGKRPDWGLALLDPGESAGLGGLSLWPRSSPGPARRSFPSGPKS